MLDRAPSLPCPHAARCAGCPLIDVPYEAQLEHKRRDVVRAFARYPDLASLPLAATSPAEPIVGYRLRAKLVAQGHALGLYARGSHAVVDIPDCRVLSPLLAHVVAAVRAELPFSFPLLALDVREADRGALVTLIVAPDAPTDAVRSSGERLMAAHPEILGVSMARRATRSAQLLGASPVPVSGLKSAPHHLAPGLPWHEAVPGGFVQAHAQQTVKLHAAIEAALEAALCGLRGRRILELYAGAGALALRLAARGARVTAADSFGPSLAELARTARAQRLDVHTLTLTAEATLHGSERPDAVIVDPPRRGLSPSVRRALAALAPRLLVYVSCDPRSLARDLFHLRDAGLAAQSVSPWDMIPLSDSVETLTLLEPRPPPPLRILYEDATLLAVEAPPSLFMAPGGDTTRALLNRARALPGNGAATLIPGLEAGASGVCLFARDAAASAELGRAATTGQQAYLTLVRGIIRVKGRVQRGKYPGAAATRYRRERVVGTHSLVRVLPEPERPQQLLQHLAAIGHPLLGDASSGDPASNLYFQERHGLDRPFLHRARVELNFESRQLVLESALAPDLEAVLASLGAPPSVELDEAAPRRE